jgi:hypothetical protein
MSYVGPSRSWKSDFNIGLLQIFTTIAPCAADLVNIFSL